MDPRTTLRHRLSFRFATGWSDQDSLTTPQKVNSGCVSNGARSVHAAHRQRLEAVETQRRDAVALVVDAVAGRVQGPRVAQLLARQTLDHLATVGVHAQRPPPRPVMVHHLQRTRRCKLDRFCRAGLGQSAAALFQRRPPLPQWRNEPTAAPAMPGGPGAQNGEGGPKRPELCIKTVIILCAGRPYFTKSSPLPTYFTVPTRSECLPGAS